MNAFKPYIFLALAVATLAIAMFIQFDTNDSSQPTTTIMITGDVMLGRHVNVKATQDNDFIWPFRQIAPTLMQADITFINLESPLVANCPLSTSGLTFCGDTRHTTGLKFAGVDVASIANNHAENYGAVGVTDTESALRAAGIKIAGLGTIPIVAKNGIRFSFLAYDDISTNRYVDQADIDTVVSDISSASNQSDVVIVMYHWGQEYVHQPSQRQKQLAYAAIDAGADLVVGNHPHWIQPLEQYRGKTIAYSHGNFIFDQNWSTKTSQGIIGQYTFQGTEHISTTAIPIVIEDDGQPHQATAVEADEITKILEEIDS